MTTRIDDAALAAAPPAGSPAGGLLGVDWRGWLVLAGLAAMFVPSFIDLARTVWPTDEQGHGPLILLVSVFLAWQRRGALAALASAPRPLAGGLFFAFGLFCYLLGRTQKIDTIEVGALLPIVIGLLLLFRGWPGVRLMAFPVFFLIFMVPLPGLFVQSVTTPLKAAVSWVAEHILFALGYPVARSGVILQVGQYQLLVADACAGLNSMFTLEALSLLYLNVMRYTSVARNVFLAVMAIPVAFCANVIRVMILILVTYHLGDAMGQGFVHDFAGLVLFMVALLLVMLVDGLYGLVSGRMQRRAARAAAPAA